MKLAMYILGTLLLTGCGATYHIQTDALGNDTSHQRHVVLFLDGTANNLDSETNVAKLSHIVKNQSKPNLHVFYNEGVGTGYRLVGAGTGWGIRKDVVEAYAFLSGFYTPESKLYIFGFSRGAYTSRILAGMIYSVGIYDLSSLPEQKRLEIAKKLYKIYKSENKKVCNSSSDRKESCVGDMAQDVINIRKEGTRIINRYGLQENIYPVHAEIDLLGLWDTVEAMGMVPSLQALSRKVLHQEEDINVINPNHRYIDQVCNTKRVLHAISLDDNRQYVFTPISIRSPYVVKRCSDARLENVKEVWFSGAHADVGGGSKITEQVEKGGTEYRDLSLSGVSLNWMIAEILADKGLRDLLPKNMAVPANALAFSHDAENGSILYDRSTRQQVMEKYCHHVYGVKLDKVGRAIAGDCAKENAFAVHSSVFQRLKAFGSVKGEDASSAGVFRDNGFDSRWYLSKPFEGCFESSGSGYEFKDCPQVRLVNDAKRLIDRD